MARSPRTARDPIGDKLRELDALDRLGLLSPAPGQRGLLPPAPPAMGLISGGMGSDPRTLTGGSDLPPPPLAGRDEMATLMTAVNAKPNIGGGRSRGLLAPPDAPKAAPGGLLAAVSGQGPAPMAQPEQPRQRPSLWSTLDDVLFGGAAGERASERRVRDQGEAAQAAHRDAFAAASAGGSFDPVAYQARMAEMGQAPDMSGLTQLEGMTDSRDVRGLRGRNERRSVTAGALAPVLGLPEEQQPGAFQGASDYLASEGYGFDPATPPAAVASMVGGAMGADAYFDNRRGDQAQAENVRSNLATEGFREKDLNTRREIGDRDFNYRRGRDETDDEFRRRQLDIQEKGLAANSTTEIAAAIQSKAITMGVESLSPEERAIYDRSLAAPGAGGIFGLLAGGAPPLAPTAPAPRPSSGGSREQAARVTSQAEFDALPAGAWFVNPADGQVMQKAR